MQDRQVVKSGFRVLRNLNDHGFNIWSTGLCQLASQYNMNYNNDISLNPEKVNLATLG